MRCKPGDVAVITQRIPDNVGKLVLVVQYHGEVDYPDLDLWKLPSWSVESLGGLLTSTIGPAYGGYIPDLALRPIGQTKISKADLVQARAEAELKAAWENLREVCREMERKSLLPEEELVESNDEATP
jgi:hypothetical protein